MCGKECRHFGVCLKCTKSKTERGPRGGRSVVCTIGSRKGTHGRCFTCKRLGTCKKAQEEKAGG